MSFCDECGIRFLIVNDPYFTLLWAYLFILMIGHKAYCRHSVVFLETYAYMTIIGKQNLSYSMSSIWNVLSLTCLKNCSGIYTTYNEFNTLMNKLNLFPGCYVF